MKTRITVALLALLVLAFCGHTIYKLLPQPPDDPVAAAVAKAEEWFDQVDYDGVIWVLCGYEDTAGPHKVRLKQLLGAAYYLNGNPIRAARLFGTCPANSSLNPTEFPPTLQAFYATHTGGTTHGPE